MRCVVFELAAYLKQVLGQLATDPHRDPLPGLFSTGPTEDREISRAYGFPLPCADEYQYNIAFYAS
jgi:hypothetical protein